MAEHTSVSEHEHHAEHGIENVGLLDPSDCKQFLEVTNERDHEHEGEGEHDHEHEHNHGGGKVTWRLVTMLFLTGGFFFVELITGIVTKSLALQSDAFHMLSDEASLIVGLVAHRFSKAAPTNKMTFGYARSEVLGGLCNAVFLLAICLTLIVEAVNRLVEVEEIQNGNAFFIVGVAGLVVNILGLIIFSDHDHNDNLAGVFLHVLGDFFGSIAVVISAIVVKYTDWSFKQYLDPILSLIIVLILVYGTWGLFKKTAMTLLESTPPDIDLDSIKEELMSIDGVTAIHELHVWELSREKYISILHLIVDSKDKNMRIKEQATNVMMSHKIFSTTIQIEFVDDFPSGIDQSSSCFFSSSFGSDKRVFFTNPVYMHSIGCPHVNLIETNDQNDVTETPQNTSVEA